MGMCALVDNLQAKVDKLLGDIEGVKTYIGDVLVLKTYCFKKHIEHLGMIFRRLCNEGLNFNAPKCSLGLKDISYLGYVITSEGIKPVPKKEQGIRGLERLSSTTEA